MSQTNTTKTPGAKHHTKHEFQAQRQLTASRTTRLCRVEAFSLQGQQNVSVFRQRLCVALFDESRTTATTIRRLSETLPQVAQSHQCAQNDIHTTKVRNNRRLHHQRLRNVRYLFTACHQGGHHEGAQ